MPRPIWSGAISFGLVNVPVKLFNAVKRKAIHFNQLRAKDGCRIRLKRVCETDGQAVPNDHIVKGYEISPDRYVVVSPEELTALNPQATRSIDIDDFVQLAEIDPLYYEQSYYLVPDKGAAKAYSLLLAALQESGKVAIARLVLRNKQYLCAIRPAGKTLSLSTMLFADEIVAQEELEGLPETVQPDKRELTIALQLIESLSAEFNPHKYRDEYHEQVMQLIERKAEGQEVIAQPTAADTTKVVDLMSALEASLAAIKKKQPAKTRRKRAHA